MLEPASGYLKDLQKLASWLDWLLPQRDHSPPEKAAHCAKIHCGEISVVGYQKTNDDDSERESQTYAQADPAHVFFDEVRWARSSQNALTHQVQGNEDKQEVRA